MVSETSLSHYVTSASRNQSRSSMYIGGLISLHTSSTPLSLKLGKLYLTICVSPFLILRMLYLLEFQEFVPDYLRQSFFNHKAHRIDERLYNRFIY